MGAPQLLHGGEYFEAQEAISVPHHLDEDVHRSLARDACKRCRDVPPHPNVLIWILQEVLEDVDDRLAVTHQRLPRAALEVPVAQERDQGRCE